MNNLRSPLVLLAAPLLALSAGDSVVAGALFTQGKKAFGSRKYEDALALFQKAWTEDPALIEAIYWKAQAHEKLKDAPAALVAYREYLALAQKKKAAGSTSAEEEKLRGLAAKRVDALAVSETEFRTLEAKYLADMLAAMRGFLARNAPAAALEAAGRVLEIDPANAEALAVRKKLSGADEADAGPFADVFQWTDILGGKLFPASENVVYGEGTVALDVQTSGRLRPRPGISFASDFGIDTEFRVTDTYGKDWAVGLFFGDTSEGHFALFLKSAQVSLLVGKPRETPSTVGDTALSGLDAAAWHSLGVVARGNRLEVWLDGKRQMEVAAAQRPDAAGEIGIGQSLCRAEWRRVRAGRIK